MWRYAEIRTVPDIIRHWSVTTPDKIALIQGQRQVSYAELDERSSRIANALLAAGAGPGSHVGFLGKNAAELYDVWFGATKAGGAIAPFNWRCAPAELAELIDDAQTPIVFTSEEFVETLEGVARRCRTSFEIVSFSADGSTDDLDRWMADHSTTDPRTPLIGTETALLAYTSGTTGRSKGVQLSHDAFGYSFLCSALEPCLGWSEDDIALMVMPNFHLAGSWVSLPALYHGAQIAILPFFEPAALLAGVREHDPTVVCLVPAAIQMVLDHPDAAMTDFSSLRRMLYAGSPISAATLTRAIEMFGCDMVQFYGTTELWIVTLLRPEQHKPSEPASLTSCGTPVHFVEIRVVDQDGVDVPVGSVGEFIVRSPVMFSGYWKQPDATAAALVNGWYHTGDLGRRDAAGFHYIVDRTKDMIVTGGENVYSIEVERALAQHPAVAAVGVIGAPDARWGERVTAFVVASPGTSATEEDLRAHCRTLIAGYKVPKVIHVETSLPMTASGKIQKAVLRERLSADLEQAAV